MGDEAEDYALRQRRTVTSQIKMESFEFEAERENENEREWADMTELIGDYGDWEDDAAITEPDLKQLIAFRPGIRFLSKLGGGDDAEDEEGGGGEEDEEITAVWAMVPKVKALLDLLPKPAQTQLLYLEKIDKNTKMIDVDSFLTFMRIKLSNIVP